MSKSTLLNQSSILSFRAPLLFQLTLSVVTFITTVVLGVVAQDFITKRLLDKWAAFALVLVMVGLFLLSTMIGRLMMSLVSIDRRIGLRVRYIEREGSRAMLFRELRSIIKQAQSSIVVVNTNMLHSTDEDSDAETAAERKMYFSALLDKVRNDGVAYHRIIQVEENSSLMVFKGERLRHFHDMLDAQVRYGAQIALMKASDTRPLTFTLVDDHWLMLEIDQRDSSGLHMEGVLIFDDPQQTVFRDFERFYQSILNSTKGSIGRVDLPALSGDPKKAEKGKTV
jgi:hypothetical protein